MLEPRRSRRFRSCASLFWRTGETAGTADSKHLFPPRPCICGRAVQRAIDHKTSHAVYHMLEIKFGDAVALEIGRRIQEVDGVWHTLLDRKFDGVHFVPEGLVDALRVAHHALA